VVRNKTDLDVLIPKIVKVSVKLSPGIWIKVEFLLQPLHEMDHGLLHAFRKLIVGEAVVIEVQQAKGSPGFEEGIQVLNDLDAFLLVVLEKKANPDQIERSHILYGLCEVMKHEFHAGLRAVDVPGMFDPGLRVVHAEDVASGLDHAMEDGCHFSRAAPSVEHAEPGLDAAP